MTGHTYVVCYLSTGDLLVVDDESVGHGGRQFDGLQPETHMTLLQDLVVQAVLQRNHCTNKVTNSHSRRTFREENVNSNDPTV